jgi:hypothetical protein
MSVGFKDLRVFQFAYRLAMRIFQESKRFPPARTRSVAHPGALPGISPRDIGNGNIPMPSSANWLTPTARRRKRKCGSTTRRIADTGRRSWRAN